jgi:predicted metal-dependent hydrolase
MTDRELTEIFTQIQKKYHAPSYKKISAKFYKSRSIKHTIEWTPWRIKVRICHHFCTAPDYALIDTAIILLAKVYKTKVSSEIRMEYRQYVESLEDKLPLRRHNRLDSYQAQGKIYNLATVFSEVNRQYFENHLKLPMLGWSRQKSYRRLGFYDEKRNLLVISRIFDDERVPEEIMRYMVYHEMLHIHFPAERRNGRRIIHGPEFKKAEKNFPHYKEIQKWIKFNLRIL